MNWNKDKKPEPFNKAKMEREIAARRKEIEAEIARLDKSLDEALDSLRQDPTNEQKRQTLREIINVCKKPSDRSRGYKLPSLWVDLERKAELTEKEFGFIEENK